MYHRSRIPSPVFLRPAERSAMMLSTRMHLHLLVNGSYDPDYPRSLGGMFNIGAVLAHLYKDLEALKLCEDGQMISATLMHEDRPPTEEERQRLIDTFNFAANYIVSQKRADIRKAVSYVERNIANGNFVSPGQLAHMESVSASGGVTIIEDC